jgi:peptide/nickel transport system substrate-binding protein
MDASQNGLEQHGLTRRELLAAGAGAAVALPLLHAAEARAATPAPKRGGRLRVAIPGRGGAAQEHLDPHLNPRVTVSLARTHALYEGLFDWAPNGAPTNVLASDLSPNADGTIWKVKIKQGVQFHNGKTLTADDVVYSLQRVTDPTLSTESKNDIYFLTPSGIRALDKTTVELRLTQPIGNLIDKMASRGLGIVPAGATNLKTTPVGTGPFMFSSFTPGEQSLFTRFPNYHVSGKPYLDELQIFTIDDPATRNNALLAGQLDAIASVDYSQIKNLSSKGFKILNAPTGGFIANYMRTDTAPYNDGRVRRGLRLLHDRDQMVKTIFGQGYGVAGNDLPMRFDPLFDHTIPQIKFDPELAKKLFKQAGLGDNPTFELQCSSRFPGFLESATLLKQTGSKYGITINLKVVDGSSYYTAPYLTHPFTQTLWLQRSLDLFVLTALDSNALFPETRWNRPAFDRFTRTARATLNPAKRKELWHKAQITLWTQGGYAAWGLGNFVDAYVPKVYGFVPSSVAWLGWFTFTGVYFA